MSMVFISSERYIDEAMKNIGIEILRIQITIMKRSIHSERCSTIDLQGLAGTDACAGAALDTNVPARNTPIEARKSFRCCILADPWSPVFAEDCMERNDDWCTLTWRLFATGQKAFATAM